MRRRRHEEAVSPRALARLRRPERGWVPTGSDLAGVEGHGVVTDDATPRPRGEDDLASVPRVRTDDERASATVPDGRHRRPGVPRGVVRLPAAITAATWQPGRLAVLGAVLVTALALAVLGLRVAWAGSSDVVAPGGGPRAGPVGVSAGAEPVGVPAGASPVSTSVPDEASPTPGAAHGPDDGAGGGEGSAPEVAAVVVHVVGQVRRPGVRRLPVGSRVSDAVRAAGGATREADLAAVNLARLLVDGEQVRVPAPGEELPPVEAGPVGPGSAPGTTGPALVPLNTADVGALDTLPGIGPVLAQRIVDWRTTNGRFTSVEELAEVSGIGEKLLEQLRPLVTA